MSIWKVTVCGFSPWVHMVLGFMGWWGLLLGSEWSLSGGCYSSCSWGHSNGGHKCVIISELKQHGLSRLAIIQWERVEALPFASYPVIWAAQSKLVNLCCDFITESRASCVRTTLFSSAAIELRFSFITDVMMTWRLYRVWLTDLTLIDFWLFYIE